MYYTTSMTEEAQAREECHHRIAGGILVLLIVFNMIE